MSNQQKVLYAFGLIIIAGIITIGSFSLGVYIGKNGWALNQPSITNPAQVPMQGAGNPSLGMNQNSPTKPDLIGITISVNNNNIELNTKQGVYSVHITNQTVFLKQDAGRIKPIDPSLIMSGTPLAITGEFDPNNRSFSAEIIVFLERK